MTYADFPQTEKFKDFPLDQAKEGIFVAQARMAAFFGSVIKFCHAK